MRNIFIQFSACALLALTACGDSNVEQPLSDSQPPVHDSMDTTFVYDGYKVLMRISKHGQQVSGTAFHAFADTTFEKNGSKTIHVIEDENRENYTRFFPNGKKEWEYKIYARDGMGGNTADRIYYNQQSGLIDSFISNADYFPENGTGHLDVCGVVTSTYYTNGKITHTTQYDIQYEALMQCQCGTWEWFDETGKVVRTEKFQPCGKGNTNCEEAR